ncbi:MAG TPA: ATP-binding cassette domain-containing protein, partial [Candidatus Dormibacteraeota bacterium]|nr:ATP-binding cassette domain-containing protein [Candidatus Dormibacteraeota bacterium]
MATVVNEPSGSSGSKRRRRRARRDARAAAGEVVHNGANGANGANGSVHPPEVIAVRPDELPSTATATVDRPEEAPSEAEATGEFRDLLGQAVGLRLDAVSREFGGRDEMHVTALQNVTLDIGPCEFVAIVGPSGCGKSTLLSLMGGLDRPTAGHVYGAGLPLGELSDRELSDYRLQRVSTVFQTFNLIPSMTAEDNVALPLTLAGVEPEQRLKRARHLLALVGLEHRARTRTGRLSGGEQQ